MIPNNYGCSKYLNLVSYSNLNYRPSNIMISLGYFLGAISIHQLFIMNTNKGIKNKIRNYCSSSRSSNNDSNNNVTE
jgi:hypothetical protein